MTPPHAWERLGQLLIQRRVDLSPRYANRTLFATERGVDPRLAYDIEKARRQNFGEGPIASLEHAYELAPGAIRRFLADGGPLETAQPDAGPPPRPALVPAEPDDDRELEAAAVAMALRHDADKIRDRIGAVLARNPDATGRDIFPDNDFWATTWDDDRLEDYEKISIMALSVVIQRRGRNRRSA